MFSVNPNFSLTTKQEIIIDDSSLPFNRALRLHTFGMPANTYSTQLVMRNQVPVKKDDNILVSFYARAVSTDTEKNEAYVGVVFEQAGGNYDKSLNNSVNLEVGIDWKKYYMSFSSIANYNIDEASTII